MTQLKQNVGCNEQYKLEEDVQLLPTDEKKNEENKSTDISQIRNKGNRILVLLAGCASLVGLVSAGGVATGAVVGATVGAFAGVAIVGIISVWLGKSDSDRAGS